MNHGNKVNKLGRKKAHRSALLSNLASQLITHKRIVTTLAKAKALRTYIEPLITKTKHTDSKEAIMHNHRIVFSYLHDKLAVKELFTVVAPKVVGRPGGYTRIIKLGQRTGDAAELAMIELVDFNEVYGNSCRWRCCRIVRTDLFFILTPVFTGVFFCPCFLSASRTEGIFWV
jgi:large subunit ribosomal protein L17